MWCQRDSVFWPREVSALPAKSLAWQPNVFHKNQGQTPRTESYQAEQPVERGIEAHSFEDRIVFNNMKHHSQQIQHGIKSLFDSRLVSVHNVPVVE